MCALPFSGLAIFVEGRDFALLYDAGSQDDRHDVDENRVVAYIEAVRPGLARIDHLILSHPHKDHLQLMPDVFRRFEVGHVWESGRVNKTDGYCHRSEEHTSELQSLMRSSYAVLCLKKKTHLITPLRNEYITRGHTTEN